MRTVSRRVRHVRQLTVPVVLGFHQRPSVQFAGFQFNLIIITRRRRRRRKKVVSVQFYAGRIPLKNTLSRKKKKTRRRKRYPQRQKETVSFPCLRSSSLSFASLFERTRRRTRTRTRRRATTTRENSEEIPLSFTRMNRVAYRDHVPFALVHQLHRNPDAFA